MATRLGRVWIDDAGVHGGPFLGLFGQRWSLPLDGVTAWRTRDEVIVSRGDPEGRVVGRVIELTHAGGTQVGRGGRGAAAFDAVVAVIERRLPGRRGDDGVARHASNEGIPR